MCRKLVWLDKNLQSWKRWAPKPFSFYWRSPILLLWCSFFVSLGLYFLYMIKTIDSIWRTFVLNDRHHCCLIWMFVYFIVLPVCGSNLLLICIIKYVSQKDTKINRCQCINYLLKGLSKWFYFYFFKYKQL